MSLEIREYNGRIYGRIKNEKKIEKEIDQAISMANSGRIEKLVSNANNMSKEEYKKNVEKRSKQRVIKGPKIFERAKRFIAIGMIGLTVGGVGYGMSKIPEYKEEAATRILETVKSELGAESIYNNSKSLSSNSARKEFIVRKDGKTYTYCADIQDGEVFVKENELDEQTIEAISIAAAAQDGNIFDAIKANKYADKIENGEINLTIDEKTIVDDGEER